jgi:hypothetical protein
MSIRTSRQSLEEIEAVARAEGISVAEAMRRALAEYVRTKKKEPNFRARLEELINRDRELLQRLSVAEEEEELVTR